MRYQAQAFRKEALVVNFINDIKVYLAKENLLNIKMALKVVKDNNVVL